MRFSYTFELADGQARTFDVDLDRATLAVIPKPVRRPPSWVALEYQQCGNCPLTKRSHPHCPVAFNLIEVVDYFKDRTSIEDAHVRVVSSEREYHKTTSLQQAISSLMGIYMVASGCPVMNKLRPMLDTHLPFMSPEESSYRTLSMYLTAQYFRMRMGQKPDWELRDFVAHQKEFRETNAGLCQRLRTLGIKDASLNALATLNAMGEITSISVETHDLARWEAIFRAHYQV